MCRTDAARPRRALLLGWQRVCRPMPLLALCLGLAPLAVAAEPALQGVWSGNDRASEAIYGRMKIGKTSISWGGANPYNPPCETTYRVVEQYRDDTYPDNTFKLKPGRTFKVVKLKLAPPPCTGREAYFQFALPSDQPGYAEVVTYGADGAQTGWHNFSKVRAQDGR